MLKQKALAAALWSGAELFLRRGLTVLVSLVLARLLSPAEFGTFALLSLFTGVAGAFADSGLSLALIRQPEPSHVQICTVFWFNVAAGALVAAVLAALAPLIADFYAQPVLRPLTILLAAGVFIQALGTIHTTLLARRLDFKAQLKVGAVANLLGGAAALALALAHHGIWALAAQSLVTTTASTLLLWLGSRWRPSVAFSRSGARSLIGFGGYMLISELLEVAYSRTHSLLIGKLYGTTALGLYNRAESTKQLPVGMLIAVFSRVAFPIFSAAAQDPAQLRRGVRFALRGMMLVNVPLLLGSAAVAEPALSVLFGERWRAAAPILQVLCLSGSLWPLHTVNLNVLMAQGHSGLMLRLEMLKKLIGLPLLGIGTLWGVMGIAWSGLAFGAIAFVINAHYSARLLQYGAWQQLRDCLPVYLVSLPMLWLAAWLSTTLPGPDWLRLLVSVASGALCFVGLAWASGMTAFADALDLARKVRGEQRKPA